MGRDVCWRACACVWRLWWGGGSGGRPPSAPAERGLAFV